MNYKSMTIVFSFLLLFTNNSVFAQSSETISASGIEEIIVTARKKEEPLQNAPDVTASINMTYIVDMANDASTVINLGWQYHDEYNASVTGYGPAEIDARGLLNASIDYIPSQGNWRISAYGKNLADDVEKVAHTNVSVLFDLAYYSDPRVLGIELAWEY